MSNHQGLKSRNLITLPLDIPDVDVIGVDVNERGDYIVTVESTQNSAICQSCGARITKANGSGREIELRHLPILGHRLYIRLRPKRYECPNCNGKTTTQKLDWYEEKSPHTKAYDRYLLLQLVNSTVEDVSRKEDVGYDAVEGAIERCIQVSVDWSKFTELGIIGIDEIAMKERPQRLCCHYHYTTIGWTGSTIGRFGRPTEGNSAPIFGEHSETSLDNDEKGLHRYVGRLC